MADVGDNGADATVEATDQSGMVVVRITGELDMSSAPGIRAAMERVLASEPTRIVLDLSGLEFVDSSGLAVLLQAAERAPDIALRNPTRIVRRVIEATGLEATLPVEEA